MSAGEQAFRCAYKTPDAFITLLRGATNSCLTPLMSFDYFQIHRSLTRKESVCYPVSPGWCLERAWRWSCLPHRWALGVTASRLKAAWLSELLGLLYYLAQNSGRPHLFDVISIECFILLRRAPGNSWQTLQWRWAVPPSGLGQGWDCWPGGGGDGYVTVQNKLWLLIDY